jgi:hypothetical protein
MSRALILAVLASLTLTGCGASTITIRSTTPLAVQAKPKVGPPSPAHETKAEEARNHTGVEAQHAVEQVEANREARERSERVCQQEAQAKLDHAQEVASGQKPPVTAAEVQARRHERENDSGGGMAELAEAEVNADHGC